MTRVIAVASGKGGVGKSTLSVNLGAALGEMGRKVLLVDVDAQAATTAHFGIVPDTKAATLAEVLRGEARWIVELLKFPRDCVSAKNCAEQFLNRFRGCPYELAVSVWV